MSTELAKVYDPKSVETEIAQRWADAGAFDADGGDGGNSYCIVIPPPNVTAALHLGHALNNTLQDVLIRQRRMMQYNTLWMPGTDHAGIATQTVVEKRILAEEGKRRTQFQRDEFIARIQQWKDEYERRILGQLQSMGCSCDWRRTRFTMDEVCAKAVRQNFFNLFRDGLIYRGKRLVNWDPATQTVLADDEVEHESVQGHFWYLQYPLAKPVQVDGKTITHVTVATTRPETMLGDTAVAMNPSDPRAAALVGKMVRLPIVGRLIPIIADELVVLPKADSDDEKARFSTGFLKVTPAHDPNDWAIGQRHDLDVINVMAPDGTISERFGWSDWEQVKNPDAENLIGMDRFEARQAIVEWFRQENLLEDVRDYTHDVGHSYRSHVPIEPYLSDQWYIAVKKPIPGVEKAMVNSRLRDDQVERRGDAEYLKDTDVPVDSLAGLALMPLMDGRLKFTPDRYARNYQSWLENLRDWPISRQLWWGHRIPVWSRTVETAPGCCGQNAGCQLGGLFKGEWGPNALYRVLDAETGEVIERFAETHLPPTEKTAGQYTVYVCTLDDSLNDKLTATGFTRDEDVLDTWFSSALWPFSTLGWPDETPELKTFYPGNVLCTAREIITLWVSRMVMMGQYCVGDIPFSDVFIHAMIQDGQGRKMSKSLGNGIDPLDIIDSHGADAMRFTLVAMTTQTQDVRMPVEACKLPDGRTVNSSPKFDLGRNFCNKLWNASRFAMMNLQATPSWGEIHAKESLADRWILSRLNAAIREASAAAEGFRFNELADTLYHFMWDDFCDWYLEIAKVRINAGQTAPKAIVAHCLDVLLRLLHPICPFITEAIWENFNAACPNRGPGDFPAEPLLVRAQWPRAEASWRDEQAEQEFAAVQDLIRQVRNARTEHNVPPVQRPAAAIEASGQAAQLIADNLELIKSLAGLGEVTIQQKLDAAPTTAAAISAAGAKLYVMDIIDVAAERARLGKQAETLIKGIKGIEGKLGNEGFLAKAPADVVQRERERLATLMQDLAAVTAALDALK